MSRCSNAFAMQASPTYCITNFSVAEVRRGENALSVSLAASTASSCRATSGSLKPQPAIYQLLLDRYGLKADDCIFIDDSRANVEGARAVGMHAIHYVEPLDVRSELRRYGILAD